MREQRIADTGQAKQKQRDVNILLDLLFNFKYDFISYFIPLLHAASIVINVTQPSAMFSVST